LEPEFIDFIRNARKRRVGKFRKQLYVFLICLVLSIFLWLLVHLSREYFYTAEYKLNYTQIPWNMRLVSCSDSVIYLTIRLQGYEFFSEQFFRRKIRESDVNLRGLKLKINDDQMSGFMLTRGIARSIAEQTSYPLEIFSTSPDTIFFTFEKKAPRKLTSSKSTSLTVTHPFDSLVNNPDTIAGKIHMPKTRSSDPTIIKKSDAESRSDRKYR
jgi:hypothetical protein